MNDIIFPKKIVTDVEIRGKTVLLRTDYNVPMRGPRIADDFRIRSSLPTIDYLIKNGAKIVIISHLGRPDSSKDFRFSLEPVANRLSELLNKKVSFINECASDKVRLFVKKMANGDVVLLENLRFNIGEETNDHKFARDLVKFTNADLFVNDAFGAAHRAHASTAAITDFVPSVAGLLLKKEYLNVKNAIENPNRPLVAIIGGAKIADKTPLIAKFVDIADEIIIGGAIANNFLMAEGYPIGASLWDAETDEIVRDIIAAAKQKFGADYAKKFLLPIDLAISKNGNPTGARVVVTRNKVAANNVIYDLGTKSITKVIESIRNAGTVIWNGTLGLAEKPHYSVASEKVAETLASNPQIFSVIGGGDTTDFVRGWDKLDGGSFSYVSTGGGASLELMTGQKLPGIENLIDRQ